MEIVKSCQDIDFSQVSDIIRYYGLGDYDVPTQRKIFENSYAVVFLKEKDTVIGMGRAISDGICQAAIYNIAIKEEYRGKGLVRTIIKSLVEQLPGCNIVLYTHPKHFGLYEHLGFKRLRTAYALFEEEAHYEEEGFFDCN